jgi:tripartite-type tricarboxylate transporter receptor subunit TctC
VRYILPLPAGQETDVFARVMANRLGEIWGQQVIVDNRPGGGTVIGSDVVAKAKRLHAAARAHVARHQRDPLREAAL